MKHLLASLIILSTSLSAQSLPERDQLIESLLQATDEKSLQSTILKARKAGLPEQMFLEARFILLINQNDTEGLAALAPALEAQLPTYSSDHTMIFATQEDFESTLHYTKALAALQQDDTPLFKKHITEAYWLSPAHSSQFAPHINAVRLKESMAKLTLKLDRKFQNQKHPSKQSSLRELAADAPIFLLHFWSPWIQTSLLAMPEYHAIANTLNKQQIPTISFLLAGTNESRKDADTFLSEQSSAQGHWLIDSPTSSLASTLRISTFPTVVLVSKDGQILFNGDPASASLWQQLAQVNSNIKAPKIDPVLPENLLENSPSGSQKNE